MCRGVLVACTFLWFEGEGGRGVFLFIQSKKVEIKVEVTVTNQFADDQAIYKSKKLKD